jgi:putative oxidoreductase
MHIMARLGEMAHYTDLSLFLLRVMIAIIFGTNAYHLVRTPQSKVGGLGKYPGFAIFLGVVEFAASIGMVLGLLTPMVAILLIIILIVTIVLKVSKWNTGFWGEDSIGWHYDLMLLIMNFVILCTGGGSYGLF